MEFDVEIVLRETNHAVTERIEHGTEPRAWRELDVETVLKQILLAIDRVKNPAAAGRHVALRGFSWIVEPMGDEVVIAIEIPMGAAVAGPFAIDSGAPRRDDPAGHRRRRARRARQFINVSRRLQNRVSPPAHVSAISAGNSPVPGGIRYCHLGRISDTWCRAAPARS